MARLIRPLRKCLQLSSSSSSSHKALISQSHFQNPITFPPENPFVFFKTLRHYISDMRRSAFEGNILRLLRNEIRYELDRSPPVQHAKIFTNDYKIGHRCVLVGCSTAVLEGMSSSIEEEFRLNKLHHHAFLELQTFNGMEPVTKFGAFTVDGRPGEQWIRLDREYGENENIKIEVTMFGRAIPSPKSGGSSSGEDVLLHITTIVHITKGGGNDVLEIMCSAWPDSLEIDRLFLRRGEMMPAQPYAGPEFKELDDDLQNSLYEYLEARGVDDQLAVFLHKYMKNKDKTEFIRWMETVKAFIEIK